MLLFSCPAGSDSATAWTAAHQASLSLTISRSLPKFMNLMPSNHLVLCRPLLLLPLIFPSIRVVTSESAFRIRWPKYWSFSISPSSEYSGLVSFRMDWFNKGTAKMRAQKRSAQNTALGTTSCGWTTAWLTSTLVETISLTLGIQSPRPKHESGSYAYPRPAW